MKTASACNAYVKKRMKNIYDITGTGPHIYNTAYFHRLRVELKKLNASLRLVKFCDKKFPKKKIFRPFKMLNKVAGNIREIQLEEIEIKKLVPSPFTKKYLPELKLLRENLKQQFLALKRGEIFEDLRRNKQKYYAWSENLTRKKLFAYFLMLKEKITLQLSTETLKPKTIHELRMLLKEFYYNIEMIQANKENSFSKINTLQDLIGKWHDNNIIIRHLTKIKLLRKDKQSDVKQLDRIIAIFRGNTLQLLNKVNKEKNAVLIELNLYTFHY